MSSLLDGAPNLSGNRRDEVVREAAKPEGGERSRVGQIQLGTKMGQVEFEFQNGGE